MAGRITKSEEQLRPDPRFNNKVLAKFTNCIMTDGRKTAAIRVIYDAMDELDRRLKKQPHPDGCETAIDVFERAIYSEAWAERAYRAEGFDLIPQPTLALRVGSLKLIRSRTDAEDPTRFRYELYDLAADPVPGQRRRDGAVGQVIQPGLFPSLILDDAVGCYLVRHLVAWHVGAHSYRAAPLFRHGRWLPRPRRHRR